MMQPQMDGPEQLFLSRFMKAVGEQDQDTVFQLANDIFGVDVEGFVTTEGDEGEEEIPFDKEDAEVMIEGRILEAMARVGLVKYEYQDHETYVPDPKPGPALEVGIRRLANTLYRHNYHAHLEADDEQFENYMADARELAVAYPHLLSGWERGIVD